MRAFAILMCVVAGLAFASLAMSAEDGPLLPETKKLYDQEYTRRDLAYAFRDAVFNVDHKLENYYSSQRKPIPTDFITPDLTTPSAITIDVSLFDFFGFRENYPWVYELIYRPKGEPRLAAISKWNKPIVISTGYPNDLKPYTGATMYPISDVRAVAGSPEIHELLEAKLTDLMPKISKATGLPVSYIKHEEEDIHAPANLRIIFYGPVEGLFPQDCRGNKETYSRRKLSCQEEGLPVRTGNAISFLFLKELQGFKLSSFEFVYPFGFYVADRNNNIEMSFCYVNATLPQRLIKGYIKQCVLRSLGFAGAQSWIQGAFGAGNPLPLEYWEKIEDRPEPEMPPLSESEELLIALLYNAKVRAGMGYMETMRILMDK